MLSSNRRFVSSAVRQGFSRVELLVVLICLTLLVMIVVPSISAHRETQRTIACQARMGSLGRAFLRYADDRNDAFPVLEDGEKPWTVSLLPYQNSEEGNQLLDRLSRGDSIDSEALHASQYLCPNGREYPVGANSYVVNGGMGNFEVDGTSLEVSEAHPHSLEIDWDGNGSIDLRDLKLSRDSGMIWRPNGKIEPWTRAEISSRDGLGQTILLSENQNAGRWQSLSTFDLAFVVGRDRITFGSGDFPFDFQAADLGPYRINFSRLGREGRCPSPGSTHGNFVNVVFADGSAKQLSDDVDPILYLRLLTPGGTEFGESRVVQIESKPTAPQADK
jgi:prepilin-type processing-associated H-X9-DG protein